MFNVFRSFLNFKIPETEVLAVKTDSYTTRNVCYRDDGMVLYGPASTETKSKKDESLYEVVLHRPCIETITTAFSLYRSTNKDESEIRFITYKEKVPFIADISKELCTTYGLKRICDELTLHPTWSLAHLAAQLGLGEDVFNHPAVNAQLNSIDVKEGMSPLQIAISAGNLRVVEILVNAHASLEHLDHNANSVFHYAASSNKDIIKVLCRGGNSSAPLLNSRNSNGHTPLHMACLANKTDCVRALLGAGADVNISCARVPSDEETPQPGYVVDFMQNTRNKLYQEDMKFGGTPLHWSYSRPVIETLIQMKCNVNALNFDGRTALHVMVMRNRLECVIALLSHDADPNVVDLDGNTPLHLAVGQGSLPIVQALLIFGTDFNRLNNNGESVRHLSNDKDSSIVYALHAVGAQRCTATVNRQCTDKCRFAGTDDGTPPAQVVGPQNRDVLNQMLAVAGMGAFAKKSHTNGERLLCLDGGGIRGLVLIEMLLELQKYISKPIVSCFDWIAGTSTGGILALGLASGKKLQEILCLYFRMKELTFVGNRPYPSEALEQVLKECFGSNTVMSDIHKPKLLIPGVLADRKPVQLHLFRNYESPSEILGVIHDSPYELPPPPKEQLLWHVGRATGAAPSYFRAFGRYLDGGLIANNPTLDALTEIHEYTMALRTRHQIAQPLKVVVSLGTGVVPVTQLKGIDIFRPESLWDTARLVTGISALGNLLVDQATASDGRVVDRARAWCSMIGVPYYRFSPQLSEDISMDEKSDEKLVRMLWETKAYMFQNANTIKEVALLLFNEDTVV